jgi:O-antigen/teichoic acid export membrane protein
MSSIKKLAIRGTIWTIASYGTSQVIRLGSNLILSRLLSPDLFGLMALVYVFITGLHLFSDVGIGTSIIQNKRGDDQDFLNTAWTMQIVRGVVLTFGCFLIAWPVAIFYDKPGQAVSLLLLIPIVGINTFVEGFNSTSLYSLSRQLAIGKLAIFELGIQIIAIGVMIVWAWIHHDIWALVIGSFVSVIIKMVWSHFLSTEPRNRIAWEPAAVKSIFSFGKWIFVSTVLTFMSEQTDRLILGRLITLTDLGIYNIAFTLADIPRQVLLAISGKVFFPTFSRLADLPRAEFRAKILQNRQLLLILAAFGLTLLTSFGDKLILLLYDERYKQAAWMLPLLAIGFWPRIMTQTIDQALFAIGKPRYVAYGSFFKFLFMAIALPLGFNVLGLSGAIIVIALNDLPFYGAIVYGLGREGLECVIQDIQATVVFILLLTVVLMGRYWLGFGFPLETMSINLNF